MNINFINLKSTVDGLSSSADQNRKILSHSVGIYIARSAQVPQEKTNTMYSFWNEKLSDGISKTIFSFNEEISIDVDIALDTAKRYWGVRYLAMYPLDTIYEADLITYDFMDKALGVDVAFSKVTHDFLNENSASIIKTLGMLKTVL